MEGHVNNIVTLAPEMLRPVTDKSKRRQVGECRSFSLQGRRHAFPDCPTVRDLYTECAKGIGVG
jgi:hypothetical protein